VVRPLLERGYRVYLLAYPGQGDGMASVSLMEIRVLADLAVKQIVQECSSGGLVLVGRSLGSGVVAYTARSGDAVGVVLESTSPRLSSYILTAFRSHWYSWPLSLLPVQRLLVEDYDVGFALSDERVPRTVIFQGTEDTQTPLSHLLVPGMFPEKVKVISIPRATHNNVFSLALSQYIETISDMFK